ncbi:hypothetical protein EV683_11475 [Crenobacter luteus]|uniref:Zinc resistance-associated protein n=1 Tax=Crenobacter luteus TaxID=1452487 RepID=A0A163DP47_9NEIS|nr:hypothetical protein [Crenobacter luteus]KZE35087.1 hypothetical protein AVW16_04690 [Crenobacter luteus]TCP11259.1 hypothetical protein EV683_11475 [Crenobacter luteus]
MKLRAALIVPLLSFGLMSAAAQASPHHDARWQARQLAERIDHGVRTGKLTPHEARRLDARLDALQRERVRLWRDDGRLDRYERARLDRAYEALARDIWRQMHDGERRRVDHRDFHDYRDHDGRWR